VSKIDLAYAPASNVGRWNGLRLLRLTARALLSALQDSRERAARNFIRDHRHLVAERAGANSFQEGGRGMTREISRKSQENPARISSK